MIKELKKIISKEIDKNNKKKDYTVKVGDVVKTITTKIISKNSF